MPRQAASAVVDPGAPAHTVARIASDEAADEVAVNGYSVVEAADLDAVRGC